MDQLCMDTGCRLEDLPPAMTIRDGLRERERGGDKEAETMGKSMLSVHLNDATDDDDEK